MRTLSNSLMDMERSRPGSCELFVTRLLQRLARFIYPLLFFCLEQVLHLKILVSKYQDIFCSSKESSLKDLQDFAARIFTKGKTEAESTNAEAESKKKHQNKEMHSNANLSPLARFLLSRLVINFSHDHLLWKSVSDNHHCTLSGLRCANIYFLIADGMAMSPGN